MDDPYSQQLIGSIVSIVILTLINAFLAGAEMAFVSLNPTKIKEMAEKGDKKANKVLKLLDDSDEFLSAIQVGITFAGFLNSASASQAFVGRLQPFLSGIPGGQTIATIIVTLILSYVTLVLGELYPKQLALQIPESYARMSAGFIIFIKRMFKPFIWLLTFSTGLLKKITPIEFTKKDEKITRAEMKALLRNSRNDGVIDTNEFNMMRGVLSLDSKYVKEIMVPRVDTFMIDIENDLLENIELLIDQSYSRIPVYKEDKDNIVGIITLKDVLINLEELKTNKITLSDLTREALFVPETLYTDNLLYKFKESKQLLAIVIDEFGGVSGLVTLEDLVEEIVGEIEDEDDEPSNEFKKINDHTYLIKANMTLETFNLYFNTSIESDSFDTIAGFVIEKLGFIPQKGTNAKVEIDDYYMVVDVIKGNRIQSLKVIKK